MGIHHKKYIGSALKFGQWHCMYYQNYILNYATPNLVLYGSKKWLFQARLVKSSHFTENKVNLSEILLQIISVCQIMNENLSSASSETPFIFDWNKRIATLVSYRKLLLWTIITQYFKPNKNYACYIHLKSIFFIGCNICSYFTEKHKKFGYMVSECQFIKVLMM